MKKIKLYIASSLNGKIAEPDGSVDWLEKMPNPEASDYGYKKFYESVDTTIQGYNTYKQIIDWGIEFPYKGKKNSVLTRNQNLEKTKHVHFIKQNHAAFVRGLKSQSGKDIWLIGGGQINTLMWNEGLIDELIVHVMPIVLSGGIELFGSIPNQELLKLQHTKSYPSGVVELKYLYE